MDKTASLICLVACTSCKRQYDGSSLAPGSKFHCVCGDVIQVQRFNPHDAQVIRCSSCGAPRSQGAESCRHCGSKYTLLEQDMHTICPSCMTRISDRARYCHSCATVILPQGRAGEPTDRICPACIEKTMLNSRTLGKQDISSLECPGCGGLWLGREAFDLMARFAREHSLPAEFAVSGESQPGTTTGQSGPLYRMCPDCRKMMNRRNFGKRSGAIIDTCKGHGLWFDARELERVLAWIREGGESHAVERDQADERERERARNIMQHAASGGESFSMRSSNDARWGDGESLFGSVLGSLFDL